MTTPPLPLYSSSGFMWASSTGISPYLPRCHQIIWLFSLPYFPVSLFAFFSLPCLFPSFIPLMLFLLQMYCFVVRKIKCQREGDCSITKEYVSISESTKFTNAPTSSRRTRKVIILSYFPLSLPFSLSPCFILPYPGFPHLKHLFNLLIFPFAFFFIFSFSFFFFFFLFLLLFLLLILIIDSIKPSLQR